MSSPPDDRDGLLKPAQIAVPLGISRNQCYRLLRSEIPYLHISVGTVRILLVDREKCTADHHNTYRQDVDEYEQKRYLCGKEEAGNVLCRVVSALPK